MKKKCIKKNDRKIGYSGKKCKKSVTAFPKINDFGPDHSGASVKCQQSVISIRLRLKIYASPTANEKLKTRQIRCVSKYITGRYLSVL